MAEIDLAPLTDRLTDEEVAGILEKLQETTGQGFELPEGDYSAADRLADIDDDVFAEFMDRLGSIAADYYLPVDFDGTLSIGEMKVASLSALAEALEDLMDEFDVEDPHEMPDEDEAALELENEGEALERDLRTLWYIMYQGALEATATQLTLVATP